MHITLTKDYSVRADTSLLGYQGETNSRKITFSGLVVEGCDLYKLQILYSDGKVYELPIQNEEVTITGSILREIGYVSCQLLGYSVAGEEYTIVFKSNIFELEIKEAIEGDVAPIPPYEESAGALEKILAGVEAAKGYAKSAETAADRAETARAEAVKSQNDAKVSAAQASTAAQQTEADKIITAGYAKTAKANADSTSADRQAVQTLAEQVASDKANVVENAAKVAEDRTAAETAAQKAQSVVDSLPEDYVTAVAKIAENTEEIASLKVSDKELQRRVNALYALGQGITHQFETDSSTAYVKTIPTGGRLMSVKSIGGKNLVFNQIVNPNNFRPSYTMNGVTITRVDGYKFVANGTATGGDAYFSDSFVPIKGHVYLENSCPKGGSAETYRSYITGGNIVMDTNYGSGVMAPINVDTRVYIVPLFVKEGATVDNLVVYPQVFDLTLMFGAGNEPKTVAEFKTLFSDDYYPYNTGEIITADTESVVVQGANLCDPTIFSTTYPDRIAVKNDIIDVFSGSQAMFETGVALKIPQGYSITVFPIAKENASTTNGRIRALFSDGDSFDIVYITDANGKLRPPTTYVAKKDISAIAFNWSAFIGGYAFKMQITQNGTESFIPYHRNTYPIPEAIKSLPGYGWSAGNAKNYVDYENKKYVQCVASVDLGTLNWKLNTTSGVGEHFYGIVDRTKFKYLGVFGTTVHNILCSKYRTVARSANVFVDKTVTLDGISTAVSQIQVKDTTYPDAATFKQAMSGVTLYYELATPVVTDISSLIPDDFLRSIEVEPLGSITFKNSNDNYRIPVPSEEEYVVKLSEVGGTT